MTFRHEFLRATRILHLESVRELAAKLKVQPSTVSRWENGKFEPYPRNVKKIARILKIRIGDLYKLDGNERPLKVNKEIAHGRTKEATRKD